MKEKKAVTTVTIDVASADRLERLAKANGVSKKEFISLSLEYFEKYGINPVEQEGPGREMEKLIKRVDQVIAFMKVQERDILRPACELMARTSTSVKNAVDNIPQRIHFDRWESRMNSNFQKAISSVQSVNAKQEEAMKYIGKYLDAKEKTSLFSDISKVYKQNK